MKIEYFIITGVVILAIGHLLSEFLHGVLIKSGKNRSEIEADHWIGGIIYYNRDDPRLLVPKKIEWLGLTLNFGNPKSIIIIAGLLLVIILKAVIKK